MTRLLTLSADNPALIQAPKTGDVLGDKYRIEREIGSGGMGIVYEVTHLVMTKKRFAVKWLLPLPDGYQGQEGQAAARRFVREAEIAGRICHPHVVEVYDVTIGDSGCFMVMELLEGESLEARLKRELQLPVPEASRIIVACASGVSAAHAANVIHRDLKPANIFLSLVPGAAQTCPKVLDFGISRFTAPEGSVQSTVTRAGTLIGTPMYMAPEQLRGFECDARTDVYALGATLYEALSGKRAYDAPTYADLVVRIVTGDARDLRQLVPALPAGLSAIVMQALHHKPEKRYPSVQALADALQVYADSRATALSVSTSAPGPNRRGIAWAAGLIAGACVLGLGLASTRWAKTAFVDASEPEPATPLTQQSSANKATDTAASETVVQPAAAAPAQPPVGPAASGSPQREARQPEAAVQVRAPERPEAPRVKPQRPTSADGANAAAAASGGARAAEPGTGVPVPIVAAPDAAGSGKRRTAKRSAPSAPHASRAPTTLERPTTLPPSSTAAVAPEPTPVPAQPQRTPTSVPVQSQRTPKPRPALDSL